MQAKQVVDLRKQEKNAGVSSPMVALSDGPNIWKIMVELGLCVAIIFTPERKNGICSSSFLQEDWLFLK